MSPAQKITKRGDVHFTRLKGARLSLRRLDIADLIRIVRYRSDPEVARFQSWEAYGADKAMSLIREMQARHPGQVGYWFQFAVELKASKGAKKTLIGDCGLRVSSIDPTQAEIGFTLDARYQGQGHGTDAVRLLVEYCFKSLGIRRLTAVTDARNLASARLLEKIGFRREAHLVENTYFKGEWASEFHYALLAREWSKTKTRPQRSGPGESVPDNASSI